MDLTSLPEGGEPRKCGHFHFYGLIAVVRLVRFGSIKGKWQKMRKDSRGKKRQSLFIFRPARICCDLCDFLGLQKLIKDVAARRKTICGTLTKC